MKRILNFISFLGLLCLLYFGWCGALRGWQVASVKLQTVEQRAMKYQLFKGMDIDAADHQIYPEYCPLIETPVKVEKCADSIRTFLLYPDQGLKVEFDLRTRKIIAFYDL